VESLADLVLRPHLEIGERRCSLIAAIPSKLNENSVGELCNQCLKIFPEDLSCEL